MSLERIKQSTINQSIKCCSECPIYSSETDSVLQCLHDLWNKYVFRALRKAGTEWRFLMWRESGSRYLDRRRRRRAFQTGSKQGESGVINHDFSTFDENNGPLTKNGLDLWPVTWPWNSGCRGTCSCKISSSWVQRFMNYRVNKHFALSRNGKTLENPVLWPWPLTNVLKFSGFRAVVIIHAHTKFHLAKCSCSWVIVRTEKKNSVKQYCRSL